MGRGGEVPVKGMPIQWIAFLCAASFCVGMVFTNRMWYVPENTDVIRVSRELGDQLGLVSEGCDPKPKPVASVQYLEDISKANRPASIHSLSKKISSLETELAAARSAQASLLSGTPNSEGSNISDAVPVAANRPKAFMIVGINTAFSSRRRRDSVRSTWMPRGERRKKLEEKGIIVRFVIGHGSKAGGVLDKAIEAEDIIHHDIMRLEHFEGYLELSAKTKVYFATAYAKWDADFYIKVDDDVHVNLGSLAKTLARYKNRPRVYTGCMKSGPVLAQKGVRYHEPEYWKFGEMGNKYFRHATGQLYAISKDLAYYISQNQEILHRYANEDVSLGSWFIGLDVQHIDDRKMCCGTTDCDGRYCIASFDWSCSGICKSAERIKDVHRRCKENEQVVFSAAI
eukprot:TRINITY_DN17533_c0_g1_i1.p1 TRINITY_DN17533_c0_g1~~TRINITY_DN17533_c0_g1_i1.p1  ORF type:complete len:399 (+),score=76.18 TRINITY_DN17533_c0_g1_i1:670-1866(+)